jgi:L-alanine-DL-glutamate epimerase-like enolase superfamily enzyme
MKRKTAIIEVYKAWGTKATFCADVLYRGKRLKDFAANETPQALCDAARAWAHANGFTHCKVSFG